MQKSDKRNKIIYQVYPLSFRDSNNDGYGDLKGIIEKLDYIKRFSVDYIWLSPIYDLPLFDNGYDIKNYKKINPLFGTMKDFEKLIEEAKKRKIGIMMDLVSVYTSDEHEWLQKSINKEKPYDNYYVWRKKIPQGFACQFENSAWTFNNQRQEFYLHRFSKKQPDLNWENPALINEIAKIINFWIAKGVKGFRFDVMDMLGLNVEKGISIDIEKAYERIRLIGQKSWLKHDLFTVGECWSTSRDYARKFIDKNNGVFSTVFNARYMDKNWFGSRWDSIPLKGEDFVEIKKWIFETRFLNQDVCYIANFIENHDFPRSVSRYFNQDGFEDRKAKVILISFFGFNGPSFIYQGQEVAMANPKFNISNYNDPETKKFISCATGSYIDQRANNGTRDNARAMLLWNTQNPINTWLNCDYVNKKFIEEEIKIKDSIVNFFAKFFKFKKEFFVENQEPTFVPLLENNHHLFGYKYVFAKQKKEIIFLANWSFNNQEFNIAFDEIIFGGESIKNNTIQSYGSIVLTKNND